MLRNLGSVKRKLLYYIVFDFLLVNITIFPKGSIV